MNLLHQLVALGVYDKDPYDHIGQDDGEVEGIGQTGLTLE